MKPIRADFDFWDFGDGAGLSAQAGPGPQPQPNSGPQPRGLPPSLAAAACSAFAPIPRNPRQPKWLPRRSPLRRRLYDYFPLARLGFGGASDGSQEVDRFFCAWALEQTTSLGPNIKEGELVFGVAHICESSYQGGEVLPVGGAERRRTRLRYLGP